ncbi:hypothetical protein [Williamsia soli]|uniref:hypothetical protein n=1 Tax=Williamsia soli TaxID=364929 RepID=UPI001A9FADD2|nr:hypothetical protein [Williamsia soli]
MIYGVLAALFACIAYGTSSVLQAYGARKSKGDALSRGETAGLETATGGPTLRATMAAVLTTAFIAGTCLDVVGFAGNAVGSRLAPLFLSQTIVSAYLVVTAILGIFVLGITLLPRDWIAIGAVVAALCAIGLSADQDGHGHDGTWFHWGVLIAAVVLFAISSALVRWLGSRAAIAAGLCAGAMFGVVAVSVRILHGISDFDIVEILSDPAAYAIALAGVGGYYLNTVALQLGSVNSATAAVVVGETVIPSIIGIIWLGDDALPGRTWLAVVGFVVAVAGAMVIAWSGAAQAANEAEAGVDART